MRKPGCFGVRRHVLVALVASGVVAAGCASEPAAGEQAIAGGAGAGTTARLDAAAPDSGDQLATAANGGADSGHASVSAGDTRARRLADAGAGAVDASVAVSADASAGCAHSRVTDSQVVFIGDSFLAAPTSQIAPDLEALFQQAGSAGYSAMPRYHQLVGTTMSQIAGQYDTARSQNPDIKVVIMDGGGNDVLVTDRSCLTQAPPANATCARTVRSALDAAEKLLTKMEGDGVEQVVFFFYPHEPLQGLFQGTAPTINDSLDYAEPRARLTCEKHAICSFVSLRQAAGDAIGSGYTERGLINANDVHPSASGSQFFAGAIWKAMQARCVLTP